MKKVALALQGGGSHGAFTWGVMDRLLEQKDLKIVGLVGTSAGAMNATVIAYGLKKGGPEAAKELLHTFWSKIAKAGKHSMLQPSMLDKMMHKGDMDYSPGFQFFNLLTEVFSPYQLNPTDKNPLKDILNEVIDFDELRKCKETKLFLCATNALTCKPKVFHNEEMSVECCLASACLPFMFKAVEIDGEAYWDGGYMGNPPIFPLIEETDTNDVLLIKINPIKIKDIPKTSKDIQDRVNEISFNSSLMLEMKMLNFQNKLVEKGITLDGELRKINFHGISADEALLEYSISSKLNTTWEFLTHLHELGRKYANSWIKENYDRIGVESTLNVEKTFL